MREFEMYELATYRCRVCGCKNKLYTDLILDHYCYDGVEYPQKEYKVVGYTTKCCNCGHRMDWVNSSDAQIAHVNKHTKAGRSKCIRNSYCPHKECKLYGSWDKKEPCPHEEPKKLHFDELDVKPSMMPKFL